MAEVLITLGIIGVVAAMTLPTLIKHYQQQVVLNQVKKFYTEMSQVLQMAKAIDGDLSGCDRTNSENYYKACIQPYIKNVDIKYQYPIHLHAVFTSGVKFNFADGTQAIFSSPGCEQNSYKYPVLIFYTKVHTENSAASRYISHPTREQFFFYINEKGYLVPPKSNDTRQNLINGCAEKMNHNNGIDYGSNGHITCSTLIYNDHWEIKSDYPW